MSSTALLVMDVQQGIVDRFDPEVHRVLTEKVFPRQADVVRIADWTASLA